MIQFHIEYGTCCIVLWPFTWKLLYKSCERQDNVMPQLLRTKLPPLKKVNTTKTGVRARVENVEFVIVFIVKISVQYPCKIRNFF